jgi:spore germination protein GerM
MNTQLIRRQTMSDKRTPTKTSLIVLAVGFAVIMGACGQDSSAGAAPDLGAAATTSTPPTTVATTAPPIVTTTGVPVTTTEAPVTTTTSIPPSEDAVEVMVYLFDPTPDPDDFSCEAVEPVIRLVEPSELPAGAFDALLAGPTDEELEAGYGSWFSAETGWLVESVTISDGVAYVDFSEDSPLIPNASTSCGSMAMRAQLDSTAMQFPTVEQTVYSFGGDVAAFYHRLQADVPEL